MTKNTTHESGLPLTLCMVVIKIGGRTSTTRKSTRPALRQHKRRKILGRQIISTPKIGSTLDFSPGRRPLPDIMAFFAPGLEPVLLPTHLVVKGRSKERLPTLRAPLHAVTGGGNHLLA